MVARMRGGERVGDVDRQMGAARLLAVWRPAPIWRATSGTGPPASMRVAMRSRPLGVSRALGCRGMGGPLSTLRTRTIHSLAGPSPFVTARA